MTNRFSVDALQVTARKSGSLVLVGTIAGVLGLAFATLQANREATRAEEAQQIAKAAQETAANARAETDRLRQQIGSQREALEASREAINAFHQRDYATALRYYDAALRADPDNAYLLSLRAYALFKQRSYDEAVTAEEQSLRADPAYARGYFDLARFQCALGKKDEARQAIAKALAIRPDLGPIMREDGEFRRLCGDITP